MSSQTRSTRLPADLAEAAEIRARQLGYTSWNSYVKGLIRYDLLVQGDHTITLPVSQLRPEGQDEYDAKLLKLTQAGKGERGQLLKKIVAEIAGAKAGEVLVEIPKVVTSKGGKKA